MKPVQMTGTGSLTGSAWITDLDIVEDRGQTLRILKVTSGFEITENDLLKNASTNSVLLSSVNDWATGVISGTAPIVGIEMPTSTVADMEVDIAWSCGTATQYSPAHGWTFTLDDLGCNADWVQEFTVRLEPANDPTRAHIQRYGDSKDFAVMLLEEDNGDYNFDHVRGDIRIRGTITAYDSTDLEVTFDELSFENTDVCDTGSYTFDAED